MSRDLNTRAYTVQARTNGKLWTTIDVFKGNKDNVTDVELSAVTARYVKIIINDPGADSTARIADVEIFGCL